MAVLLEENQIIQILVDNSFIFLVIIDETMSPDDFAKALENKINKKVEWQEYTLPENK